MNRFFQALLASNQGGQSVPPFVVPDPGPDVNQDFIGLFEENTTYTVGTKTYQKTSGGNDYNAGILCDKMIEWNTGRVIVEIGVQTGNRAVALSHDHQDWNFDSMDFGLLFSNSGAYVVENSLFGDAIALGNIATTGTMFMIEVTPNVSDNTKGDVKYYSSINGGTNWTLRHTSLNLADYPLRSTMIFYQELGPTLLNCQIGGTNLANTVRPVSFVQKFLDNAFYNAFGISFSNLNSGGNVPLNEVHHYTRSGDGGHIGVHGVITKHVYNILTDAWAAPVTVIDEGASYDLRDPDGGYIGSDLFIFNQRQTTNFSEQRLGYFKSSDNGATFAAFVEITGYDLVRAFPFGALQPSGVAGTYFQYFTDYDYPSLTQANSYLAKTVDSGANWTVQKIHAEPDSSARWLSESCLIWLGGQKYILLMRNERGGPFWQMTTVDNWANYTGPTITNLSGENYPTSVLPSMLDGYWHQPTDELYLFFQDRSVGKMKGVKVSVNSVFNNPLGYPSQNLWEYYNQFGIHNGIGYPAIAPIQLNPLKLHLVFADEDTPGTDTTCDLKYTLFDENLK